MRKKIVNIIGVVCIILFCIAGIVEHNWKQSRLQHAEIAAGKLYTLLSTYDFDTVDVDESEGFITLCQYVKKSESSSILELKEVTSIAIEADLVKAAQTFRNIRKFRNGIFFATGIGWDGEWTGICLYPSELTQLPDECLSKEISEGIYWLTDVPDHILREG